MARYPADSEAPAVIVLTRFLMVTLILGTLIRLATKWWKFSTFFRDDYYILMAMLASIAQSVAVSVAVEKGYGMHIEQLSDGQVAGILKAQYTSTFFYILGIAFSQLSFLFFVKQLARQSHYIYTALQVAIAVVAITGIFGSAFQCHPQQWDYIHDRCFNRKAWFTYLGMSMILVELAIIAQTVIVMVRVQTTWKKKANLTCVFLFRVLVPFALISHIILIHATINTPDPTSSTWSLTIATQLALCLSVITASTPQYVPVLRQLQTTGMRLDGMTRYTMSSSNNGRYPYGNSYGNSRSRSRSRSKFLTSSAQRTRDESILELDNMNVPFGVTETTVTASGANGHMGERMKSVDEDRGDDESQSSQTNIIRETRTWVVTEEHVGGPR
ncbi:hypothetical protein ASPCAL13729 [Aspergillus calidoustus]|uniref:Rhodopsin domain-containing protein n=1 Tax=Aspergillus calidoustus TaxID=454130 RepID=A0A0U5H8Z5_ASPCI|nr:hypothetical protein ASPCAL13729 [Aspergillus calidoustus]